MNMQVAPKVAPNVVVTPVTPGFAGSGAGVSKTGGAAVGNQAPGFTPNNALGFTADASFANMGEADAGLQNPGVEALRADYTVGMKGNMPETKEIPAAKAVETVKSAEGLSPAAKEALVTVLNGITENTKGDAIVDKAAQAVQMSPEELTAAKALFEG